MTSEGNKNMLALYSAMNKQYSISAKDIEVIIDFTNFSETLEKVDQEVKSIVGKLNVLIPKSFEIDLMKNYESDLSSLAIKICKDISAKLDDGILESIEIVHVSMGALNGITSLINKKSAELGNNTLEIKYVLSHFVLSLLTIILASLCEAKVINIDVLKSVLKAVSDQLETYRLLSETLHQTSNATSGCSCVIC